MRPSLANVTNSQPTCSFKTTLHTCNSRGWRGGAKSLGQPRSSIKLQRSPSLFKTPFAKFPEAWGLSRVSHGTCKQGTHHRTPLPPAPSQFITRDVHHHRTWHAPCNSQSHHLTSLDEATMRHSTLKPPSSRDYNCTSPPPWTLKTRHWVACLLISPLGQAATNL